jgi:putative membrane protein
VPGGRRHSPYGPGFFVWLLLTLGINALALIVVNWMFTSIWISGFWSYALGALALGLGNAFLKPILALLTLPLIIFTLGLAYFALNVAMLALAEWIAPHFSIDGFWTYVGATIVVWLVNVTVGWFLDRISGRPRRQTFAWEARR